MGLRLGGTLLALPLSFDACMQLINMYAGHLWRLAWATLLYTRTFSIEGISCLYLIKHIYMRTGQQQYLHLSHDG